MDIPAPSSPPLPTQPTGGVKLLKAGGTSVLRSIVKTDLCLTYDVDATPGMATLSLQPRSTDMTNQLSRMLCGCLVAVSADRIVGFNSETMALTLFDKDPSVCLLSAHTAFLSRHHQSHKTVILRMTVTGEDKCIDDRGSWGGGVAMLVDCSLDMANKQFLALPPSAEPIGGQVFTRNPPLVFKICIPDDTTFCLGTSTKPTSRATEHPLVMLQEQQAKWIEATWFVYDRGSMHQLGQANAVRDSLRAA